MIASDDAPANALRDYSEQGTLQWCPWCERFMADLDHEPCIPF